MGSNFVPNVISIWLGKQNISVPVDVGVPFQDYRCLYNSIHLYMFVFIYVSINYLIFMLLA